MRERYYYPAWRKISTNSKAEVYRLARKFIARPEDLLFEIFNPNTPKEPEPWLLVDKELHQPILTEYLSAKTVLRNEKAHFCS